MTDTWPKPGGQVTREDPLPLWESLEQGASGYRGAGADGNREVHAHWPGGAGLWRKGL